MEAEKKEMQKIYVLRYTAKTFIDQGRMGWGELRKLPYYRWVIETLKVVGAVKETPEGMEFIDFKARLNELQRVVNDLTMKLGELQAKLDGYEKENIELRGRLQTGGIALEELERRDRVIAELRGLVEALEKENADLKGRLEAPAMVDERIKHLTDELMAKTELIKKLQEGLVKAAEIDERLRRLEVENVELRKVIEDSKKGFFVLRDCQFLEKLDVHGLSEQELFYCVKRSLTLGKGATVCTICEFKTPR